MSLEMNNIRGGGGGTIWREPQISFRKEKTTGNF